MYSTSGKPSAEVLWTTCELLVDYCDTFISCLTSHSDGTHSLQRIHWWASDAMLNLSEPVSMKKLLDSLRVSKLPANIHFWVNYSFNRRNDWQIEGVSDEKCGLLFLGCHRSNTYFSDICHVGQKHINYEILPTSKFDIGFSALRSDGKRMRALILINLPIRWK